MLALTATKVIREEVSKILEIRNPLIIVVSPCKPNMVYCIRKSDDAEKAFFHNG